MNVIRVIKEILISELSISFLFDAEMLRMEFILFSPSFDEVKYSEGKNDNSKY